LKNLCPTFLLAICVQQQDRTNPDVYGGISRIATEPIFTSASKAAKAFKLDMAKQLHKDISNAVLAAPLLNEMTPMPIVTACR